MSINIRNISEKNIDKTWWNRIRNLYSYHDGRDDLRSSKKIKR